MVPPAQRETCEADHLDANENPSCYACVLIAAASRSPVRIAPSMKLGQCVEVSVPAQRIGPTGARMAGPSSAVAPGVRKPVKQPRSTGRSTS